MDKTKTINKSSHNHMGIEMLRIISMVMIVAMHYLTFGGGRLLNYPNIGPNFWIGHFMWAFEAVAVNCYVLISGYFLIISNKKDVFHKAFSLWKRILFYSLGIYLLAILFHVGRGNWRLLAQAILPIKFEMYWFVTAYFGMYILSPYLNILANSLSQKEYIRFLLIQFTMFSLVSSYGFDTFIVKAGYSFLWFIFLYYLGGYIKLYNLGHSLSNQRLLLGYVIPSVLVFILTWGMYQFKFYKKVLHLSNIQVLTQTPVLLILALLFVMIFTVLNYLRNVKIDKRGRQISLGIILTMFFSFCFELKNYESAQNIGVDSIWYNWNSPFIVISSVALFLIFLRYHPSRTWLIKCIQGLAPLTFGVYLIHMHPVLVPFIWMEVLKTSLFYYSVWFIPHYIVSVIIVYLTCSIIEWIHIHFIELLEHSLIRVKSH